MRFPSIAAIALASLVAHGGVARADDFGPVFNAIGWGVVVGAGIIGAAVAAFDVVLLVTDANDSITHSRTPRWRAVLETALAAPQLVLAVGLLVDGFKQETDYGYSCNTAKSCAMPPPTMEYHWTHNPSEGAAGLGVALVSGTLLAHGIWTLATGKRDLPVSLAPTAMGPDARGIGLLIDGRF